MKATQPSTNNAHPKTKEEKYRKLQQDSADFENKMREIDAATEKRLREMRLASKALDKAFIADDYHVTDKRHVEETLRARIRGLEAHRRTHALITLQPRAHRSPSATAMAPARGTNRFEHPMGDVADAGRSIMLPAVPGKATDDTESEERDIIANVFTAPKDGEWSARDYHRREWEGEREFAEVDVEPVPSDNNKGKTDAAPARKPFAPRNSVVEPRSKGRRGKPKENKSGEKTSTKKRAVGKKQRSERSKEDKTDRAGKQQLLQQHNSKDDDARPSLFNRILAIFPGGKHKEKDKGVVEKTPLLQMRDEVDCEPGSFGANSKASPLLLPIHHPGANVPAPSPPSMRHHDDSI